MKNDEAIWHSIGPETSIWISGFLWSLTSQWSDQKKTVKLRNEWRTLSQTLVGHSIACMNCRLGCRDTYWSRDKTHLTVCPSLLQSTVSPGDTQKFAHTWSPQVWQQWSCPPWTCRPHTLTHTQTCHKHFSARTEWNSTAKGSSYRTDVGGAMARLWSGRQ
jgi:hypothetical protein